MKSRRSVLRLLAAGAVVAAAIGCAHRGPDPFVFAAAPLTKEPGGRPSCFDEPLEDCIGDPSQQSNAERFPSRWLYPFHPDLHHRVCRGDVGARHRFLDGARQLEGAESPVHLTRVYLGFLDRCSSAGFCDWALAVAGDASEPLATRHLFLEAAKRGCESVVREERLDRVAADLGRSLSTEPKWVTGSRDLHCADVARTDQPWDDLVALRAAGCLDLGDWLKSHHDDPAGTADALERCFGGREIRYRQADCLRELAGLDRERAVALLRDDDRRGWGTTSAVNRYAKTLLRFPERGQLEEELTRVDLIPKGSTTTPTRGRSAILADEILEQHGRLLRFNPKCAVRYCEHAPLMYRLAALVSPLLDDLVIEERWPALERVDMGSGTRSVSTSIRGIPVTFSVGEDAPGGAYDQEIYEELRRDVEQALEEPHEIIIFADGKVHRLPIRNLGEFYDLEQLIGGLNSVLADRRHNLRFLTLDPHCVPCAWVLAGPGDGLIEAAFAGLIEVVDPFDKLWTQPTFDPERLIGGR